MDTLDVLEVQRLERQVKLAEERASAAESHEAVGLDMLRAKLTEAQSKLQLAETKNATDAISSAFSKAKDKQEV